MVKLSFDDLNLLIQRGQTAFQYAWDHYEELATRRCVHTLYGSASYYVGALSPSHITSSKERKLSNKPGTDRYIIYEFDENYNVIRIKHIKRGNQVDCTYHVFELNGALYARSFFQDKKAFYKKDVVSLSFSNNLPVSYAIIGPNRLAAEFYEYLSPTRMITTTYTYYPDSIVTYRGGAASFDVPFGMRESPVQFSCDEEPVHYIDFSRWF